MTSGKPIKNLARGYLYKMHKIITLVNVNVRVMLLCDR